MVLFGGGGAGRSGNVPLLFDSGRDGATLLLLEWVLVVPPLATDSGVVTGGYGRLGGGRAAGAGDGAGRAVPESGTGLALPPKPPKGPLLSGGRPVVGKSDFLGTAGLLLLLPAADAPGNEDANVVVVVVIP